MSKAALSKMLVGFCSYCKQPVTEADSWGAVGPWSEYPTKAPVHHTACRNAPLGWDAVKVKP